MKKKTRYVIEFDNLMKDWDWDKNSKLGLFPDKLTRGSSKKAWWKCSKCGHEWEASISHRTAGSQCRKCIHKRYMMPDDRNNFGLLANSQILSEWDYSKNEGKPTDYCVNSNKKVWWKCSKCGYEWQTSIAHRYKRGRSCPVCVNRTIVLGRNDLFTVHPNLKQEWNYNKNNLLGIDPHVLSAGSSKSVWWRCLKCGYEWQAVIYSRTSKGHKNGCPQCSREKQTSFAEKAIVYYLKPTFNDIVENKKSAKLLNRELDIYIPSLNLAIEYDGAQWHKDVLRDKQKDQLCLDNNIFLIRLRDEGCPQYESTSLKIDVLNRSGNYSYLNDPIKRVVEVINEKYKMNFVVDIDVCRDHNEILTSYYTQKKMHSIANSTLISEWDFEKNKGVDPEYVSIYSNKKFWWKCAKCNNSWTATVGHRSKGRNCPYCAHQKVLAGHNDFVTLYPNVANEWDYEKNIGINPNELAPQSNKKYWFKCSKCGYSWETSLYVRTSMNCGCPNCKRYAISQSRSRKVINIDTGVVYNSLKEAGKKTGINEFGISNCCRGKSKTAGGYHWKYYDK